MRRYFYNKRTKSSKRLRSRNTLVLGILLGFVIGVISYNRLFTHKPDLHAQETASQSRSAGSQSQSATWQPTITEQGLLDGTNAVRITAGLPALTLNKQLTASATAKCKDMTLKDYWAHNDPQGREPWHFIDESGYIKQAAGENLAYGFSDNKGVIDGWMNSPAHKANLLDTRYQDIGFGICRSDNFVKSGKQTIVVQHFGQPLPQ